VIEIQLIRKVLGRQPARADASLQIDAAPVRPGQSQHLSSLCWYDHSALLFFRQVRVRSSPVDLRRHSLSPAIAGF